jgi:class 3 adenylate cyclase
VATTPETHYARSGDVNIAYQVVGDGPIDLVMVPGFTSQIELIWEQPNSARYLRRLASFSRLILYDPRGLGLSDRLAGVRTLEERMDDLRSVMEATGSQRAAIWAQVEAGAMSMLFATTFPDRTIALVLYGAFPRFLRADDYAYGQDSEAFERVIDFVANRWGDGTMYGSFFPHLARDQRWKQYFARLERHAATPSVAAANLRMMTHIDVRHLLPAIRVPTLLLHHTDDPAVDVNHSRYMASVIPNAKLIESPGNFVGDYYEDTSDEPDEIEEFLTGRRHVRGSDRILATVLFSDVVGSTERATQLGDHAWRDLLAQHNDIARREVERYRGTVIKTTGDGILATFDGPARAIHAAEELRDALRELGLNIRAGLHTGEIELSGDDVAGIGVNLAARVCAKAIADEILVSRTVVDLVAGSGLCFADRGAHALKGVPGEWHLYAVEPPATVATTSGHPEVAS